MLGLKVEISGDGNRVAFTHIGSNQQVPNMVSVYENTGSAWTQIGSPLEFENVQLFGERDLDIALSEDGNKLIVGVMTSEIANLAGEVTVFEYENEEWTPIGETFYGENVEDFLGSSVDISADGNRIAFGIGGKDELAEDVGQVKVFDLVEESWIQVGNTLTGEIEGESMGLAVSLSPSGNHIAVGSPNHRPAPAGSNGATRIFEFSEDVWSQKRSTIGPVSVSGRNGNEVFLVQGGDLVVVGTPVALGGSYKSMYYFDDGWVSNIYNSFPAPNPLIEGNFYENWSEFGNSISGSIDGNRIISGSPNETSGEGNVYIFERTGNVYEFLDIEFEGIMDHDAFGEAVSMSADGNRIAIGVPGKDTDGLENNGQVLIYDFLPTSTEESDSNNSIKVYPNPTTGLVFIEGDLADVQIISVINSLGQIVKTNFGGNQIDLSDLAKGMYFISVGTKDKTVVQSIIRM